MCAVCVCGCHDMCTCMRFWMSALVSSYFKPVVSPVSTGLSPPGGVCVFQL